MDVCPLPSDTQVCPLFNPGTTGYSTRPGGEGGGVLPMPGLLNSGGRDAGEAVIESSQRTLFMGVKKSLKGHKSRQRQNRHYALSATETGLISSLSQDEKGVI